MVIGDGQGQGNRAVEIGCNTAFNQLLGMKEEKEKKKGKEGKRGETEKGEGSYKTEGIVVNRRFWKRRMRRRASKSMLKRKRNTSSHPKTLPFLTYFLFRASINSFRLNFSGKRTSSKSLSRP